MIREDLLWHGNGIAERCIARYGEATDMTCDDLQWQSLELLDVSEQMKSVEVRENAEEKLGRTLLCKSAIAQGVRKDQEVVYG